MTPLSIAIAAPDGRQEGQAADKSIPDLRPQNIRVLALEDHKLWCARIEKTLTSCGILCEVVKKMSQFTSALQTSEYHVASIDWELERTGDEGVDEDGTDALSILRDDYPTIGKVVYSVHMGDLRVHREAKFLGADYVVEKQAVSDEHSDEQYVEAVLRAARLNFFRRVSEHLRRIGRLPEELAEHDSVELSDEQERKLYSEALDALTTSFLMGEEDEVLMNLLKKRGMLREFDSPRYVSLPFHAKLAELLGYVRVTPEQLSQILRIDPDTAERLLNGEEEPPTSEETKQHCYWLASILGFVLRLSDDNPDLMPGFWTVKYLYRKSRYVPPWDSQGLCDYLIDSGPPGLAESLYWIRRY